MPTRCTDRPLSSFSLISHSLCLFLFLCLCLFLFLLCDWAGLLWQLLLDGRCWRAACASSPRTSTSSCSALRMPCRAPATTKSRHTYIHAHTYTHTHTYTHIRTHTHTYTHIHTHTHTCMHTSRVPLCSMMRVMVMLCDPLTPLAMCCFVLC
jgi:hypothetical protein